MEGVPPQAQHIFVPFREERLRKDGGLLLEGVVNACARAVATLGAVRTTLCMVKGREVEDSKGRMTFRPLFEDGVVDSRHTHSLVCSGCGASMQQPGVLCVPCKGLAVRIRAGPPLIDLAWEGSGKSAEMGETEKEAMEQADQVFHFAVAGVRLGNTLTNLAELAIANGPTACAEYPNVSLIHMNVHKEAHFQYTVILDKATGEEMESVSKLLCKSVQMQARHWLVAVDGILSETQNNGAIQKLEEYDQRRLDRTCSEIAALIASHVSMQDDETKHNRLCPRCLEKKALCEFIRCSSSAMDRLRSDKDAMTRLLQAIVTFPDKALVGNMPLELVEFLSEECPPELYAVLPKSIPVRDIPCPIFANFLVEALRRVDAWKPPNESSVRFPSTVIANADHPAGATVLPVMEWYHLDVYWVVRRWARSNRTGLDAAGVRIVRLISTVWGMHAAGAFEPGEVHSSTLQSVGEAYTGRAAAVREWAVQVLQPTLLRANLVDAKSMICIAAPEVENEIEECISAFSNISLEEVLTLTSPASPMYTSNYWRVADMAAAMMTVRLPQRFYRDFVRVILPMAVAHLGEKRCRRGVSISMRSSWISDILFKEPAIFEITRVARKGEQLPPVIFVPHNTIQTLKGRKTLSWLCDQPRRFVCRTRVSTDSGRVRGFDVLVKDLLLVMYPS
jgi:hypothetical protein